MPYINGKYYTESEIKKIKSKSTESEFAEFLISGVIAYATGSELLGTVLGGDILGSAVGGILDDWF